MGIDEDGVTFMEDGRGSGVAAYWITNSETASPAETDWEIPCLVYHIIVRVVDFIVPLSNFSIRTGQCTWFGFVLDYQQ